ncbi:MAG: endolytic transglycosylase MltG [Proteobacteria bacterium]|nr:endolytic transglycosylase MltG [Pseudomonadota bacterium]MBU1056743.1 endolytic transglycosylase MltG [Pseudomonadota bacterium]
MLKRITRGVVLFLLASALGLAGWLFPYAWQKAGGERTETVIVVIPTGSSVREISKILGDGGLVEDDVRLLILARYLGLSVKLQAGEFALHQGQTPGELLRELASARQVQHAVTIPEGLTMADIGEIFASGGWCDRDEFIQQAKDPEFLQSLGLESRTSLEGYLYPDTYHLTRNGQSAADLLRMQVRRFFSVWQDLQAAVPSTLSSYEVLILASMVEKETGQASERPLIASVFLNRLQNKMRLQSDPTVIYGLEDFSGNLTRSHLKTPSPYNTYTLDRLPTGPICNPGAESLAAVLHPAESKYLYFVSKNDGSHHFSRSLGEHNRAVHKYQRAVKNEIKRTAEKVVRE